MKKLIFIISILLFFVSPAYATTYDCGGGNNDYTGADAISTCANAVSGDDICECYDGTYNGWTQTADGTSGHPITVQAASGQTSVVINGNISLSNADYVHFSGLNISGHISSSVYSGYKSDGLHVIDCSLTGDGENEQAISIKGDHVLISGNTFNNYGNDPVKTFGSYTVVRNNTAISETEYGSNHWDFWQSGCSGPTVEVETADYTLVENNTVIDITGSNDHFALCNNTAACAANTNLIFRYNKVHSIGWAGVVIDDNNNHAGTSDNVVYNNTFSDSGNGSPALSRSCDMDGSLNSAGFNNLFNRAMSYTNADGFYTTTGWVSDYNLYYYVGQTMTFDTIPTGETNSVKNQDPLLSDPATNNFSLGAGSPAIDAGGHLTQANGSGSGSTTLIVDDASFFQDGWAGVDADYIAIGSVSNTVQISSINYGTDTITLSSAMTWSDDDEVWLYKDSDGTRVLYGTAPDIGAEEYYSEIDTTPPVIQNIVPLPTVEYPSTTTEKTATWNTDECAVCRIGLVDEADEDDLTNLATVETQGACGSGYGTAFSYEFTGLNPEDAITAYIGGQDESAQANETTSNEVTAFTIAASPPPGDRMTLVNQ